MNDSELRGLVLKALYDIRHTDSHSMVPGVPGLPDVNVETLRNIVIQLSDKGLIKYTGLMGGPNIIGRASISAEGVDVVEGNARAPISVTFDHSVNIHGSQGVQVGGQGNTLNITMDVGKLINAIDGGAGSIQEKEEAKSLLKRLVDNPLVKAALQWWAGSHTGT
jgi:hypothetical protein